MTSSLLDQPLLTAEFLAVDTETNGLPGDRCELTEIGSVVVGGGELHDRWSSLVGVRTPLSRGIQRFTGITQQMVDSAPVPEAVLPAFAAQMRGRVLVAHSASFDRRVLEQAFRRAALDWPAPPVLCTVALARRLAPLQRRRGLAVLADALGIEVEATHRALPDAETCARVFCALFKKLCAHAGTVGEAVALLRGTGARKVRRPNVRRRVPVEQRPDLAGLPQDVGVYVFRDGEGRVLYVGKSLSVRRRARSHFTEAAQWTRMTEHVEARTTNSELGALLLEHRMIKALKPPGNVAHKRDVDGYVYLRCRLDIAFPILEVAREPAAGHAVCVGPLRGRAAAAELVEQLNSLFGLRHCGRKLPRRQWPSAYGQMGRCLSPCLGDLDPNLYRERLDSALRLFVEQRDGGRALLDHVRAQIREASAAERFEQAAWLQRRHERLAFLLRRLGRVLRATHAEDRLLLAHHPEDERRGDLVWLVGGRVLDWCPADAPDVLERNAAAQRAAGRRGLGGWLTPEEVGEARLVGTYLAAHELPALPLGAGPGRLQRFLEGELHHGGGRAVLPGA